MSSSTEHAGWYSHIIAHKNVIISERLQEFGISYLGSKMHKSKRNSLTLFWTLIDHDVQQKILFTREKVSSLKLSATRNSLFNRTCRLIFTYYPANLAPKLFNCGKEPVAPPNFSYAPLKGREQSDSQLLIVASTVLHSYWPKVANSLKSGVPFDAGNSANLAPKLFNCGKEPVAPPNFSYAPLKGREQSDSQLLIVASTVLHSYWPKVANSLAQTVGPTETSEIYMSRSWHHGDRRAYLSADVPATLFSLWSVTRKEFLPGTLPPLIFRKVRNTGTTLLLLFRWWERSMTPHFFKYVFAVTVGK